LERAVKPPELPELHIMAGEGSPVALADQVIDAVARRKISRIANRRHCTSFDGSTTCLRSSDAMRSSSLTKQGEARCVFSEF
jgi:hypothetical protein